MGWTRCCSSTSRCSAAATLSVCNFYMVSQRELYPDWKTRLKYLPFLMSIGIGLCVNNTRAVLEALFRKQSEFARTPKYGIERDSDEWVGQEVSPDGRRAADHRARARPVLHRHRVLRAGQQIYGTLPFLMLFQVGFLYTGLLSILQQFTGENVISRRRKSPSSLASCSRTSSTRRANVAETCPRTPKRLRHLLRSTDIIPTWL